MRIWIVVNCPWGEYEGIEKVITDEDEAVRVKKEVDSEKRNEFGKIVEEIEVI